MSLEQNFLVDFADLLKKHNASLTIGYTRDEAFLEFDIENSSCSNMIAETSFTERDITANDLMRVMKKTQ